MRKPISGVIFSSLLCLQATTALPSSSAASAPAEQKLVSDIAQDGLAEVKLGKLAEEKGSSADVKGFAKHMVTDHSKANNELKEAAKAEGLSLPAEPNSTQKGTYDKLSKLSGKEFDKEYMKEMVAGHKKAVDAVTKECNEGSGKFKAWAEKTLPTIKEHKTMATDLDSKVVTK